MELEPHYLVPYGGLPLTIAALQTKPSIYESVEILGLRCSADSSLRVAMKTHLPPRIQSKELATTPV